MIRFYSLFVVDDDLLASPYVRRFNVFHDITLHRGIPETVNFLLQAPLTKHQEEELNVIFDPHQLSILDVEVKNFKHQSLLTVTLVAKEVGSLRVGFAFPQTEPLHQTRLQRIQSPLVTVPCSQWHKKQPAKKIEAPARVTQIQLN